MPQIAINLTTTMKKRILFLMLTFVCTIMLQAQEVKIDKELKSLVDVVVSLRAADSAKKDAAIKAATAALSKDKKWTLMDELVDKNGGEYILNKKMKRFRLSTIQNQIFSERYGKNYSKGVFLNGEDSRYNYSLIEKGIKAMGKVRYTFKGRAGQQDFVVVPCDSKTSLNVRLLKGKDSLKPSVVKDKDGILYLHSNAGLNTTDEITLEIENKMNVNIAVVVLNHNARK